MQCFRSKAGVILLGMSLLGIVALSLRPASLSSGNFVASPELSSPVFLDSGVAATLEDWWKQGQAKFWRFPLPPPSEDSVALDQLISSRAGSSLLSSYEISELSHFLLSKSAQYQVSPVLVLSMIEVESRFQRAAVSPRGAVGMMQLMPDTARQMAEISGLTWTGPSMLEDPKSNIEFGLRYVSYLKSRFNEPEYVLTAYNIGPSALRRKLESGEELPREYYDRVMVTVKSYQSKAKRNRVRPALWVKSWL